MLFRSQASVHGLGQGFQNFLVWVSYNVFLLVVLAAAAAAGVVIGKRKLKKLREQEKKPDGE